MQLISTCIYAFFHIYSNIRSMARLHDRQIDRYRSTDYAYTPFLMCTIVFLKQYLEGIENVPWIQQYESIIPPGQSIVINFKSLSSKPPPPPPRSMFSHVIYFIYLLSFLKQKTNNYQMSVEKFKFKPNHFSLETFPKLILTFELI